MDLPVAIATERRRIADLVESLSPAQLDVPSLCGDWTVRQVVGHLLASVDMSPAAFLGALVRSGFRPHLANSRLAVAVAGRPVADLAAGLRRHAGTRLPMAGSHLEQLTDLQVHGQDMRRPLGLPHGLSLDLVRVSLDFLTRGRAGGFTPRRRIAGLRFVAGDLDWQWGSGALVTGPAEALMLAMTGRPVALGEVDGPGVRVLAGRLRGR